MEDVKETSRRDNVWTQENQNGKMLGGKDILKGKEGKKEEGERNR